MRWRAPEFLALEDGHLAEDAIASIHLPMLHISLRSGRLCCIPERMKGNRTPDAMFARIKAWARNLKRDSHAIYLASRDPRVPWYAKALAIAVAAYALSPIDLIPDFIPVIGYLDD